MTEQMNVLIPIDGSENSSIAFDCIFRVYYFRIIQINYVLVNIFIILNRTIGICIAYFGRFYSLLLSSDLYFC